MATEFHLTARPLLVSGIKSQALTEALDISQFDEIDAVCTICAIVGSGALSIRLLTGMQRETDVGWVELLAFTSSNLDSVGDADIKNSSTKMLKYMRWDVTSLNGATSFTFDIGGMLRKRSR